MKKTTKGPRNRKNGEESATPPEDQLAARRRRRVDAQPPTAGPASSTPAPEPPGSGGYPDTERSKRRRRELYELSWTIEEREGIDGAEALKRACQERPDLDRPGFDHLLMVFDIADQTVPVAGLRPDDRELIEKAYRYASLLVGIATRLEKGDGDARDQTGEKAEISIRRRAIRAVDALEVALFSTEMRRESSDWEVVALSRDLVNLFTRAKRLKSRWKRKAAARWYARSEAAEERIVSACEEDVATIARGYHVRLKKDDRAAIATAVSSVLSHDMPSVAAFALTECLLKSAGYYVKPDAAKQAAKQRLLAKGISPEQVSDWFRKHTAKPVPCALSLLEST